MACESKEGGMCCPISGCPIKHVLAATVVAFVMMMGFDFLYHGQYMMSDYRATASLWRPEADMQKYFHICLISHGISALAFAGLFCWAGKSCGGICCPVKGAKFGLLAGLLVGACGLASYAWLPLESMDIPLKWLTGDALKGVITGAVLALTVGRCWKKKEGSCTAGEHKHDHKH